MTRRDDPTQLLAAAALLVSGAGLVLGIRTAPPSAERSAARPRLGVSLEPRAGTERDASAQDGGGAPVEEAASGRAPSASTARAGEHDAPARLLPEAAGARPEPAPPLPSLAAASRAKQPGRAGRRATPADRRRRDVPRLTARGAPRLPGERLAAKGLAQATRVSAQAGVATIEAPRHRTRVDGETLSFVPRDREGVALEHARFSYTLEAVTRGEQVLFSRDEGPGQVSAEGREVRVQRNALVRERTLGLDVAAEYVIDLAAAPGEGDLTVRGRVETALEARPGERGGLDFYQGEELLVAYGAAVAIDAAGRTVNVPLRYEAGLLEMRVPAAWLATAQAPLVIDPLLAGPQNLTFFVDDEQFVSVCYNPVQDEFLLVFVNSDTDLCVSRLDADGDEIEGGVILDSTGTKGVTAVAWSEASVDRYAIVYERGDACTWS